MSIQDTAEYRALRRALRGDGYVDVTLRGEYVEVTSSGRYVETASGGYFEETEEGPILALPVEQVEALLVALATDARTTHDKTFLAALLGRLPGSPGLPILLEFISTKGKGTGDLRCASLVALAKRIVSAGGEAGDLTEFFVEALLGKETYVHEYAAGCLAAVGDDRAWEAIHERLTRQLTRAGSSDTTQSILVYLARNSVGHPDRTQVLRTLVERFWSRLDHQWVATYLPSLEPTTQREPGEPDPDFHEAAGWGRKMIFLTGD